MSLPLIVAYALAFAVTGAVIVGLPIGGAALLIFLLAHKHGWVIGWALIVLFFGVFFVGLFGFLPTNNPNLQFLPPLFPFPPPEPPPVCP